MDFATLLKRPSERVFMCEVGIKWENGQLDYYVQKHGLLH